CAQFRGSREARAVPFSALEPDRGEPNPAKGRFLDADHPRWPGHWVKYPEPWIDQRWILKEKLHLVEKAMHGLPAHYREVMRLREVEGGRSAEVCEGVEISEAKRRALFHRAGARVGQAMEPYLCREGTP